MTAAAKEGRQPCGSAGESVPGAPGDETESGAWRRESVGLVHVATLGFLAGRLVPPLGFPAGLAGGVCLARAGQVFGLRRGYAAAAAAVIETVATVGPSRIGGPVTQAITAPLVGHMQARQRPTAVKIAACAALRLLYNGTTTALFIFVLSGGLDAYLASYESVAATLGFLPQGRLAGLAITFGTVAAWAVVAATIQVSVAGRALSGWRHRHASTTTFDPAVDLQSEHRFDPRAVVGAAAIAIVCLLAWLQPVLLVAASLWLVVVIALGAFERTALREGVFFAAALGLLAMAIGWLGGQSPTRVIELGLRAALVVMAAAWLRSATGAVGFREVALRSLARLRRIAAAAEAALILSDLGVERRLRTAISGLAAAAATGGRRPAQVLDSVLAWSNAEASRYRPPTGVPRLALRFSAVDIALVGSAMVPLLAACVSVNAGVG